jgi:hypothetical protein
MTPRARAFLALWAVAGLAACSGTSDAGAGGAAVTVQPASTALCIGDSTAFTAQVLDAAGHVVAGSPVRWSSSAPTMVGVDSLSGVAHALAFGTAQITATAGRVQSAKPARLDVPSDLSPEFVPDTVVLAPLDTFTLGARMRRLSAGPAPSRTPVIAPLNTTVASLDSMGLLTAKTVGSASLSLSACGFTGHGAARVFTPPDSATGVGYLWLSGPVELRVSFGTVALNFTTSAKKPAFQVFSSAGAGGKQFLYEDTLRLTAAGAFPLDSLLASEATNTLPCNPPRPFAVYGDASSFTSLVSMRNGSAAVTTLAPRSGYAAISGRATGRLRGVVGGVATTVDTLRAIYTFSAPLRDTTNACP